MSKHSNNALGMNRDHVGGSFEWEVEPACKCGQVKRGVEERFIFVGNFVSGGYNNFYMMPLQADGSLAHDDGIPIQYCPWCGEEILGAKHYSTK